MSEKRAWEFAQEIAANSNCKKRHVGCVIYTRDWIPAAVGYNYHEDGICDCVPGPSTAKHAEIKALEDLDSNIDKSILTAYVTHMPCKTCRSNLEARVANVKVKLLSKRLDASADAQDSTDAKINPKHYKDVQGVPSIEFFKAATSPEGFKGYLQLTSMKYLYRLDAKDEPIVNAKKAQWFINKLVKELDESSN